MRKVFLENLPHGTTSTKGKRRKTLKIIGLIGLKVKVVVSILYLTT